MDVAAGLRRSSWSEAFPLARDDARRRAPRRRGTRRASATKVLLVARRASSRSHRPERGLAPERSMAPPEPPRGQLLRELEANRRVLHVEVRPARVAAGLLERFHDRKCPCPNRTRRRFPADLETSMARRRSTRPGRAGPERNRSVRPQEARRPRRSGAPRPTRLARRRVRHRGRICEWFWFVAPLTPEMSSGKGTLRVPGRRVSPAKAGRSRHGVHASAGDGRPREVIRNPVTARVGRDQRRIGRQQHASCCP